MPKEINENGAKELIKNIERLKQRTEIKTIVKTKIKEFKKVYNADSFRWFEELAFCLLTAYSSAQKGLEIIEALKQKNLLLTGSKEDLMEVIRKKGHRFAEQRTNYIYKSRKIAPELKKRIKKFESSQQARVWLKKNIKGLGWKEASHFLRNVGYLDLAIIDRHILSNLKEYGLIEDSKISLTKKRYHNYERILKKIASQVNIPVGEMDLYLWYRKTGKILK
jgi:N-glycosylase/DNA lyase